jgi:hypothetical protein
MRLTRAVDCSLIVARAVGSALASDSIARRPAPTAEATTVAATSASSRGSGPRTSSARARAGSVNPCSSRVPTVTISAMSTRTGRSGVSSGKVRAAARVTTPRIPAQEPTADILAASAADVGSRRRLATRVKGKIQIGRAIRHTARTASPTATPRPSVRSLSSTRAMIVFICRPMSKKTAFSRRKVMLAQLIRSDSREEALCRTGALCANSKPAMTTARTPEPWTFSAGT